MAVAELCEPKTHYGASDIFPDDPAGKFSLLAAEAQWVVGFDSPDLASAWGEGRFTQTDPIQQNRPTEHYVYCGNNPVSRTDPHGLFWWWNYLKREWVWQDTGDGTHEFTNALTVNVAKAAPRESNGRQNVIWVIPNGALAPRPITGSERKALVGSLGDEEQHAISFAAAFSETRESLHCLQLAIDDVRARIELFYSLITVLGEATGLVSAGRSLLRKQAYSGVGATEAITLRNATTAEVQLKGSGPFPGVIEVSGRTKGTGAFMNWAKNNKGTGEFVYDPINKRMAVGDPHFGEVMPGSPHQQLARSIGGSESNVVGGTVGKVEGGKIYFTEDSGHFWRNWSPEARTEFRAFVKERVGLEAVLPGD